MIQAETVGEQLASLVLTPIGRVHSCYKEKFGIPRQAGLVSAAQAEIRLDLPFGVPEAVRGLEQFSHVWVVFWFNETAQQGWHPTVRPPRLGGNERLGVFATRSTFRPNPLGLSAVRLERLEIRHGRAVLHVSGMDLVDGTPILDIKPYLPYADRLADASGGFAPTAPTQLPLVFSEQAAAQCARKAQQWQFDLELLIRQVLQQDPRPSYRSRVDDSRQYAMRLYDFDLRWHYVMNGIEVLELADV